MQPNSPWRTADFRTLFGATALSQLGTNVSYVAVPLIAVTELDASPGQVGALATLSTLAFLLIGLPASALGLYWAAGGVGLLLGARCARPLAARLGYGRTLGVMGLCLAPAGLLVPLIDRGPWLWIAGTGGVLAMFKTGMDNVLGVGLRQRMTSDDLRGRMNATFRFALTGALAVGAAAAGLIGELAGVRATLWVGAAFLATALLPVFLSPSC